MGEAPWGSGSRRPEGRARKGSEGAQGFADEPKDDGPDVAQKNGGKPEGAERMPVKPVGPDAGGERHEEAADQARSGADGQRALERKRGGQGRAEEEPGVGLGSAAERDDFHQEPERQQCEEE